jgi:peptidyl-prolyl cis-trans isomerase C
VSALRLILLLCACGYVLADLLVAHGPLDRLLQRWVSTRAEQRQEVARIADQSISVGELAQALRHRLFRQGLDWDQLDAAARNRERLAALNGLADDAVLRSVRLQAATEATSSAIDAELDDFIAEFHPRSEFQRRLALQQLTEGELVRQITARQADQRWLETELSVPSEDRPPPTMQLPAVWLVSHLFLTAHAGGKPDREAEAQRLYQELQAAPQQFTDMVARHSDDERTKRRGGELGWMAETRTPTAFMAAVRSQPLGKISAPVRTSLGWHLLLVHDHKPARAATTAEAWPEWQAWQHTLARARLVPTLIQQLRQQHADSYVIDQARLAKVMPLGYPLAPQPIVPPSPSS